MREIKLELTCNQCGSAWELKPAGIINLHNATCPECNTKALTDQGSDIEIAKKVVQDDNSALDVQPGGSHYKDYETQPIEFITKNNIEFIEGNVIKYMCRHGRKNGKEDLEKAKHYIDLLIELEYGE